MIREPKVFLFDEPLSNLDAKLRVQMRVEIKRLHRRLGTTSVFVTHDQIEAMTLADRLAVLDHGRLEQVGPPAEVYRRPASRFVAGFLGSPPMNFLDGHLAIPRRSPCRTEGASASAPAPIWDPRAAGSPSASGRRISRWPRAARAGLSPSRSR